MNYLQKYLLISCFLISCKNTEKAPLQEKTEAANPSEDVASNEAKVTARIISIDQSLEDNGPCSKAPCNADIKIEGVSKKGPLFKLDNIQDTISVRFSFTLSATEKIFPNMKTIYPGLKINDKFEATMQSRSTPGGMSYIIYSYKKIAYEK